LKTLLSLFVFLICATHLYADQALVLTEIEQIQEKIWYLQRDLATQKSAIEKQQERFTRISDDNEKNQRNQETHFAATAQTLASQQDSLQKFETTVQRLQEEMTGLINEFNQQNLTQLHQADKLGTEEELLRSLREEFLASRKQTEQTLAEMKKQLAETHSELAALKINQNGPLDQFVLWGGVSALALAILLTIFLAFRSGRSRQCTENREFPTKHEL